MQQTPPKTQNPLGRPPNREHTAPGEQIPDSPLGAVQLSKTDTGLAKFRLKVIGRRLPRPAKGLLSFVPDAVNRLLKRPALRIEAPN